MCNGLEMNHQPSAVPKAPAEVLVFAKRASVPNTVALVEGQIEREPALSPYIAELLMAFVDVWEEGSDPQLIVTWGWPLPVEMDRDRLSVVVHCGDERAGLLRRVAGNAVVFKEYGCLPHLSATTHRGGVGFFERAEDLVAIAKGAAAIGRAQPVTPIPIGYWKRVSDPGDDIRDRETDVFFVGSVEHRETKRLRDYLPRPKLLARTQLLQACRRLEALGERRVMCINTRSFGVSAFADPDEYAVRLGQSKIALAPRGTSRETYRHFEAAAAGCVVLSSPLPRLPFYRDHPFVIVRDWSRVDRLIEQLLSDPDALHDTQRRTREWYAREVDPAAVGSRMARVAAKSLHGLK